MANTTAARSPLRAPFTFLSIVTAILLSPLAHAQSATTPVPPELTLQKLLNVVIDSSSESAELNVALDANSQVQGIDFYGGSPLTHHYFTLDQIQNAEGVVLDTEQGHAAIKLQGTITLESQNDTLTVSYLNNGLFNTYDNCQILFEHADSGDWQINNAYTQQPVSQIEVKTWKLGITTLEGICN
jgi:hypothetical protein